MTFYLETKALYDAVRMFRNLPMLGQMHALRSTPEYASLCRAWESLQDRFEPDSDLIRDPFVRNGENSNPLKLTCGDGTYVTLNRRDGGFNLQIEAKHDDPEMHCDVILEQIFISHGLVDDADRKISPSTKTPCRCVRVPVEGEK